MKTIVNDYCIRMFVGHDNLRPAMHKVNFENGYLYSTDAHIVAKIPANLCIHNYVPVEKYPNAEVIFNQHVSLEKKIVSVDTLFNELMKIEVCFKPKMVECDNCDDGFCTCDHCNSEYECKECRGTGEKPSNELVLSGENNCILFGVKYNLKYLDLILKTAIYTGVKEIEVSNPSDIYSGTIFCVGDFTILLMPIID